MYLKIPVHYEQMVDCHDNRGGTSEVEAECGTAAGDAAAAVIMKDT
jgi:hypothetical protein